MRHVPGPVYLTVEGERVPTRRSGSSRSTACARSTGSPTPSATWPRWPTCATTPSSSRSCACSASPGRERGARHRQPRPRDVVPPRPARSMDGWLLYAQQAVAAEARARRRRSAASSPPTARSPGHRRPGGHDPRRGRRRDGRSRPRRTPTRSPATTCRRPSSGRPWSSPPSLLQYPERLNAATELIDVAGGRARARPAVALRTPDGDVWTYGELLDPCQPGRAGARRGPRPACPATGCCSARPTTRGRSPAWLGVLKAGGIVVTTISALRARS